MNIRSGHHTLTGRAEGRSRAPDGAWEVCDVRLPFSAAHAALVPGGKVLFLAGDQDGSERSRACLWDPESGSSRMWDFPANFSLGAHCFLPDGRLIVAAGDTEQGVLRLRQTYLFDPWAEDWVRVNDIPGHGPCPTLLQLGDGRVLAAGGAGRSLSQVYEKSSGWRPASSQELDWPLYPQLTLLADGSILYSGQHFGGRSLLNPGLLRPDGAYNELPADTIPPGFRFSFREQGGTVLLPSAQAQQVMVIGGGSPPKPDVHVIDFSTGSPAVHRAAPLSSARANFSTVVLPDRSVMVCGGRGPGEDEQAGVMSVELFDPSTRSWRPVAPANVRRPEHSSAVLLPDGRVLTAGSTNAEGEAELRLEIFSPPYLFKGRRPTLEAAPDEIAFGEPFPVQTADADIHWLSLVKPMAASHGSDPGQRLVDVPFASQGAGMLQALAPENANIAPPGWYLLFLVNHAGVPSLGKWVFLRHASASETTGHAGEARQEPADRPIEWPDPLSAADEIRHNDALDVPALDSQIFWAEKLGEPPTPEEFEPEAPHASAPAVLGPIPPAPVSFQPPRPVTQPEPLTGPDPATYLQPQVQPAPTETQTPPPATQPSPSMQPPPPEAKAPAPVLQAATELQEAMGEPKESVGEGVSLQTVADTAIAPEHGPSWPAWARPALIIASGALLTLGTFLEVPPIRMAFALIFLLFAPGMAIVGFFRPKDWATDIGLAIGLSVALETLLTVGMLQAGTWSPERVLLILMAVSLSAAAVQLVRASLGRKQEPTEARP